MSGNYAQKVQMFRNNGFVKSRKYSSSHVKNKKRMSQLLRKSKKKLSYYKYLPDFVMKTGIIRSMELIGNATV